jgi:Restriction endonuclease
MKRPTPGHLILRALQCLKDSGPKSFEQLTADLLSHLIGFPVRLCKSGSQGGIDSHADGIPIAIEAKRYDETKLDEGGLEEKLSAAARRYPDLQLWILSTTTELSAQGHEALKQTAENLGLGVFVLDRASVQPYLAGIPAVSALAATDIGITLQAVSNQSWRDRKKATEMPSAKEVKTDLDLIRDLPDFPKWEERLRGQLHELPLWRLVTERQNCRLAKLLESDAHNSLGSVFDPSKVVSRTAKNQITEWWRSATTAADPEIAIVLGERFDGKTWCVFDWLRSHLRELPLPVFFIGSNRGSSGEKSFSVRARIVSRSFRPR